MKKIIEFFSKIKSPYILIKTNNMNPEQSTTKSLKIPVTIMALVLILAIGMTVHGASTTEPGNTKVSATEPTKVEKAYGYTKAQEINLTKIKVSKAIEEVKLEDSQLAIEQLTVEANKVRATTPAF